MKTWCGVPPDLFGEVIVAVAESRTQTPVHAE